MAKSEFQFSDFLAEVDGSYKDFVNNIHTMFLTENYKVKIESKASGFFVSYSHPETKRSVLNFLFRKVGLIVRVYADNHSDYAALFSEIPEIMIRQMDKATPCKRLLNTQSCNPNCLAGYDFYIGENHYQKCRNSCFYFEVNSETIPFLTKLIESEHKSRCA